MIEAIRPSEARLHNFHPAGKDDEERDVGLAEVEEDFAAVDVQDVALRANPIDLRWSENPENSACAHQARWVSEVQPFFVPLTLR